MRVPLRKETIVVICMIGRLGQIENYTRKNVNSFNFLFSPRDSSGLRGWCHSQCTHLWRLCLATCYNETGFGWQRSYWLPYENPYWKRIFFCYYWWTASFLQLMTVSVFLFNVLPYCIRYTSIKYYWFLCTVRLPNDTVELHSQKHNSTISGIHMQIRCLDISKCWFCM